MQLKKLEESFYKEHSHLKEALDNIDGRWSEGKTRGYGVVIIELNSLMFALPLRSSITHTSSFPTVGRHNSPHKGLDYTKALLISDPSHISAEIFRVPTEVHNRIKNKEHYITKSFQKYVTKYRKAVLGNDHNVLGSVHYRFSTLQNYHQELDCL